MSNLTVNTHLILLYKNEQQHHLQQYLIGVSQFLQVSDHLFQEVVLNQDLQPGAVCGKGMLFVSDGPHHTGRHQGHRNVIHHTLEGEMPTVL